MAKQSIIKKARKATGLTQEDVATKLGVSRSFYALIETGLRRPTYGQAIDIAGLVGLSPEAAFPALRGYKLKTG